MAEQRPSNKPTRSFAKPLRETVGKLIGKTFAQRGFASAELVTRWAEIAGPDIAAYSEPLKIQWTRPLRAPSAPGGATADGGQEPGTLVLRVEGPAAIEIQHEADVICERVNRFLGWRAVRSARRRYGAANANRSAPSMLRLPRTLPPACPTWPTRIYARRWRGLAPPCAGGRPVNIRIPMVPQGIGGRAC
jgi:hypothetical protein